MLDVFKEKQRTSPLLVFDIGGTNMRVARVDGGKLGVLLSRPTPQEFEEGVRVFEELAREVLAGDTPHTLSGGICGVLNRERLSLHTSRLSDWIGKPLTQEFKSRFNAPVHLENDAALAALAEAREGAGAGRDIVVYFTVSTGVGGARVVRGKLDASATGFEPGHQIIAMERGEKGTLEYLVSGTAITRDLHIHPRDLSDEKKRAEYARTLAWGIRNSILHWSPDITVFGGSLMLGKNSLPLSTIKETLEDMLPWFPLPEFALGKIGDSAGLVGARIVHELSYKK